MTITRSDGVDFAISAGKATGDGDASSNAVVQTTNGTFGEVADAGDIAKGLADITSASGKYAFSSDGGVLTITRSDGVDSAIAAGVAIGDGNAASDAVDQTSNGSVEVVYSAVKVTLSDGEVTYSSYADLSKAKTDADDDVTDFFASGGDGFGYSSATNLANTIGAAADGDTPASGLMAVLAEGQRLEGLETAYFTTGAGKKYDDYCGYQCNDL